MTLGTQLPKAPPEERLVLYNVATQPPAPNAWSRA